MAVVLRACSTLPSALRLAPPLLCRLPWAFWADTVPLWLALPSTLRVVLPWRAATPPCAPTVAPRRVTLPLPCPSVVAVRPRTLLVANQGTRKKPGKTVSLIDLQTFKVAKTVVTGAGAHGVVVDRDGRFAYVTNIYANSVSVLDVKEMRVTKTVAVGKSPNGISITP